ncbi:MAG: hypothetical protein ABI927_06710, partial [Gaiellaceae bacterium]
SITPHGWMSRSGDKLINRSLKDLRELTQMVRSDFHLAQSLTTAEQLRLAATQTRTTAVQVRPPGVRLGAQAPGARAHSRLRFRQPTSDSKNHGWTL